jgi:diguanylate cyclase (GGDEF)-like protein
MKESERRLLIARLHRVQARARRTQRRILRLEAQVIRDSLTGVYNRPFLLEALDKEIARCQRQQSPVGLLFVDVDGFKAINDDLGHLMGDHLLKRVAAALSATLRQADILARYGGDEFLILPMAPNEAGLPQLAERLRLAVEQRELEAAGIPVAVGVSIGGTIGIPHPSDDDFARRLLASADAAMYEAKRSGKDGVKIHRLQETIAPNVSGVNVRAPQTPDADENLIEQ